MSASGSAQGQPREINLMSLSLEQLAAMQKQFEEEMKYLTNSYSQLKQARDRFADSKACLEVLKTEQEGKKILVPLTSSVYVPGQLGDLSYVTVDIGTGYYVQKSIPDAQDFLERKMEFIKKNLDTIQEAVMAKRSQIDTVTVALQNKLQIEQHLARQAQQKAQAQQ
eukprot:GEZU01001950.1.p1 GENE.GEZU01001950.1~~GEZU01001950.1.p1  ORF type:complete len:176 (+),score=55.58 GEZU01001950.1:28-528(+)